MSCLEIVILEQFFIGEVAVLGLDRVQLVTERKVVLISLLDFKDLSLELGNEEILLITGQMDGIVVLKFKLERQDSDLLLTLN